MKNSVFEIVGLNCSTLTEGVNQLLGVVNALADNVTEFCVEGHFQNSSVLEKMSSILPSKRYSCYCWRSFHDAEELEGEEFSDTRNARLAFNAAVITVEERHDLPPYDWDGHASGLAIVRLAQPFQQDRQPSLETIRVCTQALAHVVGRPVNDPIKTVTEWAEEGKTHNYLMEVPSSKAFEVVKELCSRFELKNGDGSFEFLGSGNQIVGIERNGHYRFDCFPQQCWSFNQGNGKTAFALERASLLYPVLNAGTAELQWIASQLDSVGDHVSRCNVVRRYIPWKLSSGVVAPKTQSNLLLLSRNETGFAMFIGFEQFADKDPKSKEFSAVAEPAIERLGWMLKKVPRIR